jgi:hypothetical protein
MRGLMKAIVFAGDDVLNCKYYNQKQTHLVAKPKFGQLAPAVSKAEPPEPAAQQAQNLATQARGLKWHKSCCNA